MSFPPLWLDDWTVHWDVVSAAVGIAFLSAAAIWYVAGVIEEVTDSWPRDGSDIDG